MYHIFCENNLYGIRYANGSIVYRPTWETKPIMLDNNTVCVVRERYTYRLIQLLYGCEILMPYASVRRYSDNLLVVERDGVFGIINTDGGMEQPMIYEFIAYGHPTYNIIVRRGRMGLVDAKGHIAYPCRYDSINYITIHGTDYITLVRRRKTTIIYAQCPI